MWKTEGEREEEEERRGELKGKCADFYQMNRVSITIVHSNEPLIFMFISIVGCFCR